VKIFSGERESGLRDAAMWVAHVDAMVARERRCEYTLQMQKKS
jgi:hypothetical protein